MRQRILEICRKKKKTAVLLLVLEALLILAGAAGLFGKDAVYEFGPEQAQLNVGTVLEDGTFWLDSSFGQGGNVVDFPGISLPAGVYRISLRYRTDTDMVNMCMVTDEKAAYRTLLTNGCHLFQGLRETDYCVWLLKDTESLSVHAQYGGSGSLTVEGLTIRETNALARIFLFLFVILCFLVNTVWLFSQYDRAYGVETGKKNVLFGLALITVFASLPLMTDYLTGGGDLIYHLMRIEGIKDGILAGQFPVRIAPKWQFGYGYASSVFYGETVLYLAAFLRLIGFTVTTSYQIFLFLVNAATAVISYLCFRKLFQNRYVGLLCSALYTLSLYRLYKTYCSGSLGETMAMLFLPLLLYGFYRVFTQDIGEESYRRSWIPLTIGFTGILQSHFLTCELVGGFVILFCVILWKRVLRRKTFLVLAKTVIYSGLLSAWFLVPFLDYMLRGDFVIQHVSARTIQDRGLYPAHHLLSFFGRGGSVDFAGNGMYQSDPASIGAPLLAVLVIWLYLWLQKRRQGISRELLSLGRICAWFGMAAIVMSLSSFPWNQVQLLNGVAATLVSSLQFPNRFLTIASLLLTALAGVIAKIFIEKEKRWVPGAYFGGLMILLFCSSIYLLNDLLFVSAPTRLYNGEDMGVAYVAGGEYLPYGTDASLFTYHDPMGNGVEVSEYRRDRGGMEMVCRNTGDQVGTVELALLYYRGYQARDLQTGEMIPILDGINHSVTLVVPAGYTGRVRVSFVSPWFWRAAEGVSVSVFCALFLLTTFEKRREKRSKRG